MTRTELIAALEAAEGPSRDLDILIERERKHPNWRNLVGKEEMPIGAADKVRLSTPNDYIPWAGLCPHYTESIDAALSFTPEGYSVHLTIFKGERGGCPHASVGTDWDCHGARYFDTEYLDHDPTPAIALCIANLRALEAQEEA